MNGSVQNVKSEMIKWAPVLCQHGKIMQGN
jgi:hypothetical protein